MNVQIGLFQDEKQIEEQRKILNLLLELSLDQIEKKKYRNFYGTPAAIAEKRKEVEESFNRFRDRVVKAFPGVY
ncbi:hypothetical protein [Fictibacillus sp. NRS-1165]|uniref:hypothetical protein n=1 Tax=Fictibacillus sp. NRS-1165 TaxID=3144463 RepID=UPI003D2508C5